jgi:hypothetical protein
MAILKDLPRFKGGDYLFSTTFGKSRFTALAELSTILMVTCGEVGGHWA